MHVSYLVQLFQRYTLFVAACTPGILYFLCVQATFVCTYKSGGAAWKDGCFRDAPAWVTAVMDRGFKSPPGVLAILGLMGCPLFLWARKHAAQLAVGRSVTRRLILALVVNNGWVGAVVIVGRFLAAGVEVWAVQRHLRQLLADDVDAAQRRLRPRGATPRSSSSGAAGGR